MIKDSSILVLGAGQIGRTACREIIKRGAGTLILHTLTAEETQESLDWLHKRCPEAKTKMIPSFGNALIADPESNLSELDYRFRTFTKEVWEASVLWRLINKHRPDMIVDGINTATAVGYKHDPFTTPRKIKAVIDAGKLPSEAETIGLFRECLLEEAIPRLVRFIQVLHQAMLEFQVKRYIKITTSALGGMGFNIPYTHGDVGEPGCSPKILGKVAASGILNQLIWTLSHTPGLDIKMIIPTALVGWEDITTNITSRKKNIPVCDCEKPLNLHDNGVFAKRRAVETGETLQMAVVDSGENGHYAMGDMTTITTLGQMGCVTKEEVAKAVTEALEGSSRYDACAALDTGCLGPSFNAAFERISVLNRMKELDKTLPTASVSTGNLGPRVTKHLWELEILLLIGSTLNNILKTDPEKLESAAEKLILQSNPVLRRQILSLRMPIILKDERILLGSNRHIPAEPNPQVTPAKIAEWANEGWVDIRKDRIQYWQGEIGKIVDFFTQAQKSPQSDLLCNRKAISLDENFCIGEVLGLIYSLNGGQRKF